MNPILSRAAAAAVAMWVALGCAAPASADTATPGTYIAKLCNEGTTYGLPIVDSGGGFTSFVSRGDDSHFVGNSCSRSVGLQSGIGGGANSVPLYDLAGWTFSAPSGTEVSAFSLTWDAYTRPFNGSSEGYARISGNSSGNFVQLLGVGTSSNTFMSRTGLHDTQLQAVTGCDGPSNGSPCPASTISATLNVQNPQITLFDAAPPAAGSHSGSAEDHETWKATETLSYSATDAGSGVARFRLYVDGGMAVDHVVDTFNGHCAVTSTPGGTWAYNYPRPCPTAVDVTEELNTTALVDGQHTMVAKIVDASGREATLFNATKLVANQPPVLESAPAFTDGNAASQPRVGQPVSVLNDGTWAGPSLTFARAWEQCDSNGANCTQIPGATTRAYTPQAGDVGHRLRFAVVATNAAASVTGYSPMTGVVSTSSSTSEGPIPDPVPGIGGTTIVNGPINTTTNASHTFIGQIAGEQAGAACPGDKATLVLHNLPGAELRLGYGKPGTVEMALTCSNSGKAITNARLEVTTKVGSRPAAASDITTDGNGHALLALPAGAGRSVTVGYRMYADDSIARATATLKVRVSGRVSLKANHKRLQNGQAVTLRGTLAGGNIPRRGVMLNVQWKDGARWRPFAQIRANTKGTFRYAYRFTRTSRRVTYQLRVQVAKGQIDYPFEAATSKRVKVIVAP